MTSLLHGSGATSFPLLPHTYIKRKPKAGGADDSGEDEPMPLSASQSLSSILNDPAAIAQELEEPLYIPPHPALNEKLLDNRSIRTLFKVQLLFAAFKKKVASDHIFVVWLFYDV